MRRFRPNNEGVLPDDRVLALWRCDEEASTATLTDFSYSSNLHLIKRGAGPLTAQTGLFMSGLEGTPDVTGPDLANLTHWSEADDTTHIVSGSEVFTDKGPYTFTHGTTGANSKTALVINSIGRGAADTLNGKNGFFFGGNQNPVHAEDSGQTQTSQVASTLLFDPTTLDFTVQFLGRIPLGAAGSSYWLRIQWTGIPGTYLSNEFSVSDVRWGRSATFDTIHAIDGEVHLYTITKSGSDWAIYLDDDFDTPVVTFSLAVASHPLAVILQTDGTKCSYFALLTYNTVKSTTALQQNAAYLSSAARWGDSWL